MKRKRRNFGVQFRNQTQTIPNKSFFSRVY